jgi:hypothetical protein
VWKAPPQKIWSLTNLVAFVRRIRLRPPHRRRSRSCIVGSGRVLLHPDWCRLWSSALERVVDQGASDARKCVGRKWGLPEA